jgi:hypothetical protein
VLCVVCGVCRVLPCGSPVVAWACCTRVPSSRLLEDKEGYVLYTVVILKKFVESFRNDCRTKKFPVRDFTYVPEHAGSGLTKIEKLEADLQETLVRYGHRVGTVLAPCGHRVGTVWARECPHPSPHPAASEHPLWLIG